MQFILMKSINMLKLINIANKKYVIKVLESIKANAKIRNPRKTRWTGTAIEAKKQRLEQIKK